MCFLKKYTYICDCAMELHVYSTYMYPYHSFEENGHSSKMQHFDRLSFVVRFLLIISLIDQGCVILAWWHGQREKDDSAPSDLFDLHDPVLHRLSDPTWGCVISADTWSNNDTIMTWLLIIMASLIQYSVKDILITSCVWWDVACRIVMDSFGDFAWFDP